MCLCPNLCFCNDIFPNLCFCNDILSLLMASPACPEVQCWVTKGKSNDLERLIVRNLLFNLKFCVEVTVFCDIYQLV